MSQFKDIVLKVLGHKSGPITRLISPHDLGKKLKPFVFLDFLNFNSSTSFGFDFHPHSGIATLTYQLDVDVAYTDTEGRDGILKAKGLEWMQAGGGAWHKGTILSKGQATGFQLWIALPPGIEDGPSMSAYYSPESVPSLDGLRILLGSYKHLKSPIPTPFPMNYFDIELVENQTIEIEVPKSHKVSWAFVYEGSFEVNSSPSSKELIIFGEEKSFINLKSLQAKSRILFGSAEKFNFDLVTGSSSVHTNEKSLKDGEKRINEIGMKMLKKRS